MHYGVLNYAKIHTHTCRVTLTHTHTHTTLSEAKLQHIQPEHLLPLLVC